MPASAVAPTSPAAAPAASELAQACSALWLATLSLMTAFMQNPAPAHRLLLARRISRNLGTLQAQDCFDADCRRRFARLSRRWADTAQALDPQQQGQGGRGLVAALLRATRNTI
jgi:hypothetical protein